MTEVLTLALWLWMALAAPAGSPAASDQGGDVVLMSDGCGIPPLMSPTATQATQP